MLHTEHAHHPSHACFLLRPAEDVCSPTCGVTGGVVFPAPSLWCVPHTCAACFKGERPAVARWRIAASLSRPVASYSRLPGAMRVPQYTQQGGGMATEERRNRECRRHGGGSEPHRELNQRENEPNTPNTPHDDTNDTGPRPMLCMLYRCVCVACVKVAPFE